MHKIKQIPEDFIVREISDAKTEMNGQYAYYTLKKTGYTTIGALQVLSEKFGIPLKNFGFAGNKDKNAVTEQKISIFRGSRNFENIKLNGIELIYLGNGKDPISLGDLKGNEFAITIRNLDIKDIEKIKKMQNKNLRIPSLFGRQRFGKNNHLVGKAIIKRNFKKALELILEGNGVLEDKIRQYLKKNKNDCIGALRIIPLKTRKLLVHSCQSFLFNKIANEYLKTGGNKKGLKDMKIPIIGFNFEMSAIKNKILKNIIKSVLDDEKIAPRDFITSRMPELASEGGFRDLFFELNFKILDIGEDELNENKQKIRINLTLPKSCYATTAIDFIFQ